jgi:hypothetical protein
MLVLDEHVAWPGRGCEPSGESDLGDERAAGLLRPGGFDGRGPELDSGPDDRSPAAVTGDGFADLGIGGGATGTGHGPIRIRTHGRGQ